MCIHWQRSFVAVRSVHVSTASTAQQQQQKIYFTIRNATHSRTKCQTFQNEISFNLMCKFYVRAASKQKQKNNELLQLVSVYEIFLSFLFFFVAHKTETKQNSHAALFDSDAKIHCFKRAGQLKSCKSGAAFSVYRNEGPNANRDVIRELWNIHTNSCNRPN